MSKVRIREIKESAPGSIADSDRAGLWTQVSLSLPLMVSQYSLKVT